MHIRTGIIAGKGLGDAVAEFTNLTGIDQLAAYYEKITGQSCGCDERRETLNQLFPFPNQPT